MKSDIRFSSKDKEILKSVYLSSRAKNIKLWLVGGALRDNFLGRQKEFPDFDFILKRGAISFAKTLAKKLKAGFVILDEKNIICRVVRKIGGKIYTFDFSDFRGANVEIDLLHRDFSINSMALDLENVFTKKTLDDCLIDPYGARKDLEQKIIRSVNSTAFVEDPLRILRVFSFAAMLGFEIDDVTLALAKKNRKKLIKVSGERVRDELFKIFDTCDAAIYLEMLDKLKILEIIFPEIKPMRGIGQGPYHHLDVWQHTLESIKGMDQIIRDIQEERQVKGLSDKEVIKQIKVYLDEIVSSGRKRRAVLKLAALLHDIGKPKTLRHEGKRITFHGHERAGLNLTQDIAGRLKLSLEEMRLLRKNVLWHLRPGYLGDMDKPSERAKFRYFRDTGNEGISTLLLSIADQRATKGPLSTNAARTQHERVVFGMIREYYRKNKEKEIPRLLNGFDLMKKFHLEPSKLIGEVLAKIEEETAIGKIKSKEGAFSLAQKIIAKKKK